MTPDQVEQLIVDTAITVSDRLTRDNISVDAGILFRSQMMAIQGLGLSLTCQHIRCTPIPEAQMTMVPPGVQCYDAICHLCGSILRSGTPWKSAGAPSG